MANINAPFGFRQYSGNGSSPTYEQVAVSITNTAGVIYYGDPVVSQADGSVAQPIAASTSTGNSPAALGVAGIFQGCKYLSVSQKRVIWSNYWPGSDAVAGTVEGYIINDPNAQFVVQTDATGMSLQDVNATAGYNTGAGVAANGISGAVLERANLNAANNAFLVKGIVQAPPGANGVWVPGPAGTPQPYVWAIVGFSNVTTKNFTGV